MKKLLISLLCFNSLAFAVERSYLFITNNFGKDVYLMSGNFTSGTAVATNFNCIQTIPTTIKDLVTTSPEIYPETFTVAGETFSSYVSLIPNGTTVIYRVLDTCTGTATNRNDNILFTSTDNVDSVLYSAGNLHIESQQIVANSLLANVYYPKKRS